MRITRKVNCRQSFSAEGYLTKLKFFKGANSRDSNLCFVLDASSISGYKINEDTGAKKSNIWPFCIRCELPGRFAEEMATKLKEEDLVNVEGKLRQLSESGQYKLVVVHLESSAPIEIEFDIPDEETDK